MARTQIEQLSANTRIPHSWPVAVIEAKAQDLSPQLKWSTVDDDLGTAWFAVLRLLSTRSLFALHAYKAARDIVVFGEEGSSRAAILALTDALEVAHERVKDPQGKPLATAATVRARTASTRKAAPGAKGRGRGRRPSVGGLALVRGGKAALASRAAAARRSPSNVARRAATGRRSPSAVARRARRSASARARG